MAGAAFGLFFVFVKYAWPVRRAVAGGHIPHDRDGGGVFRRRRDRDASVAAGRPASTAIALASGVLDAAANVCYVLATRIGQFGLAVVITSLYPGMTVLLARLVLGERMRWVQRIGLLLAAFGIVLVTV